MPALLLPLHRRRAWLDLFARADLVSIPPAVLLQRTQLAGPKTHRRRNRLHACRQRLCAYRRPAAGADVGRSALARRAASHPRSLCQTVLSGIRRLRSVLPLELHAGRVRHRSGVPLASRPQTALSTAFPPGHPDRQSRTRGDLPRPQDHSPTRPRDRQSVRNPDRGHLRQASLRQIFDKFALVLRIETTTNDVSTFKHYRKVEHQQGPASYALAPVKKNIYSLTDL